MLQSFHKEILGIYLVEMKHAYLIIAHNEPKILSILVSSLKQDSRNDVLVHIDKKVKGTVYSELETAVLNGGGKICSVRVSVSWGDFSQIRAEMALFDEAAKGKYDYYHLLSGVDLPIKPIAEIGDFFEEHPNQVFLRCVPDDESNMKHVRFCTDYYHFMGVRDIPYIGKIWQHLHLRRLLVFIQQIMGMSRCAKDDFKMYKGDQWVSLSHDAVEYLLSRKDFIFKRFSYCCCPDEIYKHTVLMNSQFHDRVYQPECSNQNAMLRLIDWKRGIPYVWTMEEKDEILASGNFFARKFSTQKDDEIVDYIDKILSDK